MRPSTPPRPVDITAPFPELREHAATATRLHPRRGNPGVADSSISGPLLWPADEPWPVCAEGRAHLGTPPLLMPMPLHRPEAVRREREIYATAEARAVATGTPYAPTEAELAQLTPIGHSEPVELLDQPIPLVPVAQLYRRDVPDLPGPDGADLLQVLWCPLDHPDEGWNPKVLLRWRRSEDVGAVLLPAPEPPVVHDDYLPNACLVHPEQVVEHPYADLLVEELAARIAAWEQEPAQHQAGVSYDVDLSLAPGWKLGGHPDWSLTDPLPLVCAECGADPVLLLTVASDLPDQPSWRSADQDPQRRFDGTGVQIGRGYSLYVFRCPVSFDHPRVTAMQ